MSNIDLSQFHDVFFEESFEGLAVIESGLLDLDTTAPNPEIINNMFRAAHSIKGGAGTFGFQDISEFTHVVESILDDARSKSREVTDGLVQLLLESVDFMKRMLIEAKAGTQLPLDEIEAFTARLQAPEDTTPAPREIPAEPEPADEPGNQEQDNIQASGSVVRSWKIEIDAHPELFVSGHDPYRMIRELGTLGQVTVTSDTSSLQDLSEHLAEHCYITWEVMLAGDVTLEQIESVFEWIDDEAEIRIEPVEDNAAALTDDAPAESASEIPQENDAETAPRAQDHPAASAQSMPEVTSIRVNIDRVDHLVNLVGELVITQSMLSRFKDGIERGDTAELMRGIEQLEENTRELQDHTMRIRMLPIDSVFQRLPRLVRDVSRSLDKDIELAISGNQTEVDKTVLEKISDPLTHLVRNCLDHGIESKEARLAAGKSPRGRIEIKAYHEGGSIVIEVADDGGGLNRNKIREKALANGVIEDDADLTESQIDNLIFSPGFSTADQVSDVSGRGVGMDVVKNNIEQLNGHINLTSEEGTGTRFTIRLPLTLSIIEGQLVRVGGDIFIIPLLSIIESTRIDNEMYGDIAGNLEMYRIQGDYIRIVRLDEIYNIRADYTDVHNAIMVVVNAQERFGLMVDEVLEQQQVVVKSLETNFKLIPTVSGATILGDGTVAMILDIASLFRESFPERTV